MMNALDELFFLVGGSLVRVPPRPLLGRVLGAVPQVPSPLYARTSVAHYRVLFTKVTKSLGN